MSGGQEMLQGAGGSGLSGIIRAAREALSLDVVRDLKRVQIDLDAELTAAGSEGAAAWVYSLPFKNRDGTTVTVEGPSIRAAEAMQRAFGFLATAGVVLEDRGADIIVGGIVMDLTRGNIVAKQRRVAREQWSKSQNRAVPMKAHAIEKAVLADIAKATRDAIFATVPSQLTAFVMRRAKELMSKGAAADVPKMLAAFSALGVVERQLEHFIGRPLAEIGKDEYLRLRMTYQAIRDGEQTIEEVFGEAAAPATLLLLVDYCDQETAEAVYRYQKARGRSSAQVDALFSEMARSTEPRAAAVLLAKEANPMSSAEPQSADAGVSSAGPERATAAESTPSAAEPPAIPLALRYD